VKLAISKLACKLSMLSLVYNAIDRVIYLLIVSFCNSSYITTIGGTRDTVDRYLPDLFQPYLLCAGYQASSRGSCEGDSGGPLVVRNASAGQYYQVGLVSGGVTDCGNTDIPDYYTRLDNPEISEFIQNPDNVTKPPNKENARKKGN
jgi:secreted trypsin-like serine protease